MIDSKYIEDLINDQISRTVEDRVDAILAQNKLFDEIEMRITEHVKGRITARFANLSSMPDLVATVKTSVKELMDQGSLPGLGDYVQEDVIRRSIDNSVQSLIKQVLDDLTVDQQWLEKIESVINQTFSQKISQKLNTIDVNHAIAGNIDNAVARWYEKHPRPSGMIDTAQQIEITVMDGAVVIERDLHSENLFVESDAEIKKNLTVNNLVVKGSINTDNHSWNELSGHITEQCLNQINQQWRDQLIEQVLDMSKKSGIDFASVLVNGSTLVDGDCLGQAIKHSHLLSVGVLQDLTVTGASNLSGTMTVDRNRVGINTQSPESALNVWDQEVSIVAGKLKEQVAFIGTSRAQALSIGVNRSPAIEISVDGGVAVKNLRVGRHRIVHEAEMPGYSGTKGDIVFNSNPKGDGVWAWQCLGAFRWIPLRTA
jgi:hypothetical protein